ncbi:MAG: magnesium/cobalt transporter CorA [Cyclobacteriaceae bacterium]|nr:magnesium/cobalt transporter CorA [Cyclobacteriaceae bacterium]
MENYSNIKTGLPPGTLVYVGKKTKHSPTFSVIWFNNDEYEEKENLTIEQVIEYKEKKGTLWVNIDGVHDPAIIEAIGKHFSIHSMLLEDIMHTEQRPKLEETDDYLFLTMNMISLSKGGKTIEVEQISFVLGENYVISFQEMPGDVFDFVRNRLRNGRGKIRSRSADYLMYALMDVIVDHYFHCTDYLSKRLEFLDDLIETKQDETIIREIKHIKKTLLRMRKSVLPLRDISKLLQDYDSELVDKSVQPYFKDVFDHILAVFENIETSILMTVELKDAYATNLSLKANKVMQVLTIIATIFIPLTFIAGVYGMNFDNMPELRYKYGYFILLSIMGAIGLVLLYVFRRNKWI